MKKTYLLLLLVGMFFISSATYAQTTIPLYMKYGVEVFGGSADALEMNVQVWIPGQPATIATGYACVTVVPQPVSGSYTYAVPVPSMDYDIYSIRIYDNSGNQNDATVGEGLATTDDFDYAPFPPHGIKL